MSTEASSESARLPRFGRAAVFGFGLALLLLGTAYTAPLVVHVRDTLPYAAVPPPGRERVHAVPGDYLQFYYYLWLVRDRLLAGASILRDPYQFAVDGPRSNLPNLFLPAALLFVPLSAAGPRLAYNALVLLSFPFAGLAAALLARRYGVSRPAAAVAGVVFACIPYRLGALLGGHPAGLAYPLVPLILWGLEGALGGSRAAGLVCGMALLGAASMEPHFAYFAALGLPLYALARIALPAWRKSALAVGGAGWLLAAVIGASVAYGTLGALARQGWGIGLPSRLALGALLFVGTLALWQGLAAGLVGARVVPEPRAAARASLVACLPWLLAAAGGFAHGARVGTVALALPPVLHGAWCLARWRRWWDARPPLAPLALAAGGALAGAALLLLVRRQVLRHAVSGAGRTLHEVLLFSPTWEDLVTRVNPAAGRALYPGLLALALAAVGVATLGRHPPQGRRRVLWSFPPLLVVSLALSLGPRLPALPLFEVAFRLVPAWNFIRQPAKLQVLTALALALLAGIGLDALARGRRRRVRLALALAVALGVAAEYHPWRPTGLSALPDEGEPFATIRAGGPRALWIPFWPGDSAFSGRYLYATTLTRVPMLNGYSAFVDRSYLADVYRPLEAVNLGQVGPAEVQVLHRHHVRQVILDRDAFPLKVSPFGPALTLAHLRRSPYLDPVEAPGGDGGLWIFRVRETARPGAPAPLPSSPLGLLWEAESLARDTGRVVEDAAASNGRVTLARAGADPPGFLAFGPYRLLPPGAFRAHFRVKGAGATVETQVTAERGRLVLARAEVPLTDPDAFVELPLSFALEHARPLEYRVRWNGQGWAAADAIAVAFADQPEPAPEVEVEALAHELRERADPAASAGLAAHASPERTPRDVLWSGPLRRYPAGRYRLWVRLKLDAPGAGVFARCAIELASRGGRLGGRDLRAEEVPRPGEYVELAVPFALSRTAVLEFPCAYRGGVGVWFDRLRIERLEGPA
jgi:hypothetical protein